VCVLYIHIYVYIPPSLEPLPCGFGPGCSRNHKIDIDILINVDIYILICSRNHKIDIDILINVDIYILICSRNHKIDVERLVLVDIEI
jgi:hypothetical protein